METASLGDYAPAPHAYQLNGQSINSPPLTQKIPRIGGEEQIYTFISFPTVFLIRSKIGDPFPGVGPSLAFAIEPLEQNPRGKMAIGRTLPEIIRYGVIVQMPHHTDLSPAEHLTFPQNRPATARPVCKIP